MSELKTTSLSHKDNNTGTPNITMYPDGTTSIGFTHTGGLKNQLINGGLDIWQRGSAAFSGGSQYTADRWFVASASATTTKEYGPLSEGTGASYALKVTDPSVICEARQNIEYLVAASKNNPAPFAVGKQYTISGWVLVTDGVKFQVNILHRAGNVGASNAVFFATPLTGNGNWQYFSSTFTMTAQSGGDKNCLQVQLRTGSPGEMTISQIQLEPGPVSTVFEQRPIALELSLAQRYFQTFTGIGCPMSDSGDLYRLAQTLRPVQMRVKPLEFAIMNNCIFDSTDASDVDYINISTTPINKAGASYISDYTADAEL